MDGDHDVSDSALNYDDSDRPAPAPKKPRARAALTKKKPEEAPAPSKSAKTKKTKKKKNMASPAEAPAPSTKLPVPPKKVISRPIVESSAEETIAAQGDATDQNEEDPTRDAGPTGETTELDDDLALDEGGGPRLRAGSLPRTDPPASSENVPNSSLFGSLVDYASSSSEAEVSPPTKAKKHRSAKPKPARREHTAVESDQEYPAAQRQVQPRPKTDRDRKGKGKAEEPASSSEETPPPPAEQEWVNEAEATSRAMKASRCKHPSCFLKSRSADLQPSSFL